MKNNEYIISLKNRFKELSGIKKAIVIGIVAIYIILFYSYIYNDILETSRMGIAFWEDLFSGRIRYFYDGFVKMEPFAYTKDVQGVYDFPIYIVFAIWNFPLYVVDKVTSINVFDSVICLMWMKTLLLLFVVLLLMAMNKLARTMGMHEDDCIMVDVLFLTSSFFMSSIILASAYDIIPLYFAVLGVEAWARNDMKKFVIFYMCAIPLKFFSLLLFVPLLLLREKRILRIISYTFMSVLPIVIFRIIIPCTGNGAALRLTDTVHSTDLSNLALLYAITNLFHLAIGEIYFSVFGWVVLFAACYFVKLDSEKKYREAGLLVCFYSYMILFVTCFSHPYWLLIMMPFVHLIIVKNKELLHINLILEIVFSCTMIVAQIVVFPWCFGNGLPAGMVWRYILGRPSTYQKVHLVSMAEQIAGSEAARKMVTGVGGMGSTIFVACIIMFSVINFPKDFTWKKYLIFYGEKPEKWVSVIRVLASIGIGIIPLLFYVISL